MSKRKEIKIRRLKSRSIWPRVLTMIFVDILVIVMTFFLCYLAFAGLINSYVIKDYNDAMEVVELVDKNWNEPSALENEIVKIEKSRSSVDEVYVIDDDFNVLNSFDKALPDFNDVFGKKSAMELKEFRIAISDVNMDELKFTFVDFSYFSVQRMLFMPAFVRDVRMLEWASRCAGKPNFWVACKTSLNNVNVCLKISNEIYLYHLGFAVFIGVICAVILILLGIYEITKICMFIFERRWLNRLVTTDFVTGGYNKDFFVQKSQKLIKRNPHKVVVNLRLEKYRNYCTAYGIKMGENLLEEIVGKIAGLISSKELIAHIEKADFALLLNYVNQEQLNLRINSIEKVLGEIRKNQHLLFSAGVCEVTDKKDDINYVLSCAGLALSKTDESKKETIWFNDKMKEEQVWERRIEDDMEMALTNHEFKVYLQPKYSTKKEELAAAEALVRWIHPVLGFISPGKFIPIFENNGFILKLDDYMLIEVAKLQAGWLAEGKQLVPISVNVSRAHFTQLDLAEHICSIVDLYKVPHQYIELELTESAFFDDKDVLLGTVRKLKEYGFKVSMDDFGAGYSSLNSLKELPLDIIKLDAEFFRGASDINRSNLIVGDTISLAKKLGMEIVAEGIETREQVDFLAQQDCDLIQGFYFAKPLPVEEFVERAYGK